MSPDVLIVGAGPVGLSLAAMLVRQGLSVRVVDKNSGPSIHSKAQIVHARTLEVCEELGLVDRLLETGKRAVGLALYTRDLAPVVDLRFLMPGDDTRFPFLLSIPQRDTELLLAEHLANMGVQPEWGVRLDRFEQDGDGVTSTLVHPDGREEAVCSPFLVGCDGAHSTVRKHLGLSFEGSTYEWKITQADVRVDFPVDVPQDRIAAFVSPEGPMGFFPLPGDNRYRILILAETENPTLAFFQETAEKRAPQGTRISDPAWMVCFRSHCRMVDRYRVGRVFLAGDAAHIHSPAGGQGMNTGIQDAWNLAWKLALAVRGRASEALLDSYDAERRPVAAAVLAATDRATNIGFSAITLKNSVLTALRDHVLSFVTSLELVRLNASRALSELDIGYPDSPLVGQARASLLRTRPLGGDEESPSLGDWFAFGDGPTPGARVPNVAVEGVEGVDRVTALLRGTGHTLLLFDGPAASETGYERLSAIARQVTERFGDRVRCHVVVPGETRPDALPEDLSVVLDTRGELHRALHARAECLYLVRPDGYVGFRAMPADGEALAAHLERVFDG